MNKTEQQQRKGVDALHLLAFVQPPAGMEQRLLQQLERARMPPPVSPMLHPRLWRMASLPGCALVIAGALLVLHPPSRDRGRPSFSRSSVTSASAPAQARVEIGMAFPSKHTGGRHLSAVRRHPAERPGQMSYPAPPAPLTRQERLVLQLSAVRSPAQALAKRALLQSELAEVPGDALPSLPRELPGRALPAMAATSPGQALPSSFPSTKSGEQP